SKRAHRAGWYECTDRYQRRFPATDAHAWSDTPRSNTLHPQALRPYRGLRRLAGVSIPEEEIASLLCNEGDDRAYQEDLRLCVRSGDSTWRRLTGGIIHRDR